MTCGCTHRSVHESRLAKVIVLQHRKRVENSAGIQVDAHAQLKLPPCNAEPCYKATRTCTIARKFQDSACGVYTCKQAQGAGRRAHNVCT